MALEIIALTSQTTLQLVQSALKLAFPETRFDVSLDVPIAPYELTQNLTAAIVSWQDGPRREQVEDVLSPFQSLDWDSETGVLREAEHFEVTPAGRLQRIVYGIDYVVCDGPDVDLPLEGPTTALTFEE